MRKKTQIGPELEVEYIIYVGCGGIRAVVCVSWHTQIFIKFGVVVFRLSCVFLGVVKLLRYQPIVGF